LLTVRVQPGEEVMETVTKRLAEAEVTAGAIVSVIGAVDECCISNMPEGDAKSDVLTEFRQPFEFSGTGEVRDGQPHIHATLGTDGNAALSGHLHWARVETHFVHVYIVPE
jgi:predicted DNA-binding protein with PD1-like motif